MKNLTSKPYDYSPINEQMNLWRQGFIPLPTDYIKYHKTFAMNELDALEKEYDFAVEEVGLVSDGWMDGTRVIRVVITTRSGLRQEMKWNAGHSGGGFMVRAKGGGWISMNEKDLM